MERGARRAWIAGLAVIGLWSGGLGSTRRSSTTAALSCSASRPPRSWRLSCLPGQPDRRCARLAAAALDRRALLRHLSVALSGHRADVTGEQPRGSAAGAGADRGQHRHRGAVLEVRRGAGPARRDRPGLAPDPYRAGSPGSDRRGWPRRPAGWASSWWHAPGWPEWSRCRPPSGAAAPAAGTGALSASTNSVSHAGSSMPRPARALRRRPSTAAIVQSGHLRTSCTSVVHIGDSTSDGLVSSDYLPKQAPADPGALRGCRRADRLHRHHRRALGGRGAAGHHATAYDAAKHLIRHGFMAAGCLPSAPMTPPMSQSGPTSAWPPGSPR